MSLRSADCPPTLDRIKKGYLSHLFCHEMKIGTCWLFKTSSKKQNKTKKLGATDALKCQEDKARLSKNHFFNG